MRFSHLLMQAALALASPASLSARQAASESPAELLLRFHNEVGTDHSELTLSTPDKANVYTHTCGNTLEVAGKTIAMNIDWKGSGSITVDDKEYQVIGDRERSGGASCTKMYSDKTTIVECSIPWDDSLDNLAAISADDIEECFSEEPVARRRSIPEAFSHPFKAELEKRQGGCIVHTIVETTLVGDGNPHQDTLHKQVGPSQTCAQRGTCFVGVGEEVSITIEASIGIGGDWISGGFAVSKTTSSSTERGCYGEAGDTVCQWSRTHHTAYTAVTSEETTCGAGGSSVTDPFVIRSPNKGSQAVEWYCVLNTCRGDGDQYWELGRAGGP